MRSQRPAPPLGMVQVVYAKDMEPTKNWVCHPVSGFLGQVVRLVWWAVVAGAVCARAWARVCTLCRSCAFILRVVGGGFVGGVEYILLLITLQSAVSESSALESYGIFT